MGLAQFEQRLERLVEGAFAKAFRSDLEPVELGRRLVREMDLHRTIGVKGLIAPNDFVIALSENDYQRFSSFLEALTRELADAAREHGRDEHYSFIGPIKVEIESDKTMRPGSFRITAELQEGPNGSPGTLVLADGRRIEVGDEPISIGRLPECDIALSDSNISRRHAQVKRDETDFLIFDLDSTNGTKVNGSPVKQKRLADGDEITIGTNTIRFESS